MAARYSKHTQILVLLGLLACVALYQSLVAKRWPLWTVGGLVPVAAWVVQQRHLCHLRSVEICGLIDYYGKGTARLARKWDELDEGKKFLEQDHLYSTDLDLFCEGSLYQLLCSARTHIARKTLATWMKAPAKREEILARQEAISELRPRRDLPESIVTAGPMQVSDFRPEFLKSWVGESSRFPVWAPVLALLLALAVITQPVLYWSGFLALHTLWAVLVKLLLIEAVFAAIFRSRVKSVLEPLDSLSIELPTMRDLLRIMEREPFTSAKLKALGDRLGSAGRAPSRQIKGLLRLIGLVKQRQNEWFAYPSFCLLWGTQFAMAIERWRRRHGERLLEWMAVLGEFEALISLSTYSYEHPTDPFPELTEGAAMFEAEGLGDPLLEESTCVRNYVQLGEATQFLIVSGSNMSGKSTFLRAIGMNAVLAFMGAPVRSAKLRLSPLAIGAAIRLQHSVVDGRSHFLAECRGCGA